ncbi:transglycosylase domain-containing protein [Sanguibacter sp. 4.1]|uniref:Transglycosylase domain-containing protein n=1 Tax=Sanguibacter biliveldensis TaxID=3030830 RepID=A0AAF0Z4F5_9MICO|nr:transglycosylase domain-containing protein [Sanguibacter sp. 4.1]WPF82380.1 transglycosylase domain-containing protein [Sanguibacter sp. 4.1]
MASSTGRPQQGPSGTTPVRVSATSRATGTPGAARPAAPAGTAKGATTPQRAAAGARPGSIPPAAAGKTSPARTAASARTGTATKTGAATQARTSTKTGAAAGGKGAAGAGSGGKGGGGGRRRFFNYPRYGKGPIRRWIPSWRFVLGAILTGIALVCGVVIAAYVSLAVPTPDSVTLPEKSTVYYGTGQTMTVFADQDREIIPGDQIPQHVRDAAVAAEDRSFYDNSGIDPKGLTRAFIGNVKAALGDGRVTGGSTITQQYVERYYTGETTTSYAGKFKEMLLAVKIDRQEKKEDILANYLNTIYLGRGAYGIQVAATKYFGIPASELTVSQGALIAGIIPSPSNWDPQSNPEKAQERWKYVLDGMLAEGFLTQAEYDEASATFPETIPYEQTNRKEGSQGYLIDMVERELAALPEPITREQLDSGGLSVHTTIDYGVQQMALDAVAAMPQDSAPNLKKSVVTIDAATGGYLALYGGSDFLASQFNSATMDVAQAGSTFKPFTLMAALEAGKTLKDTFDGNNNKYFPAYDYTGRNFSNQNFGRVTLEKATQDSINTAYLELNDELGPQATVDTAIKAGIPADSVDLTPVLTNVLGTASVHPVDIARAYTTFAANGQERPTHIVASVTKKVDGEDATVYTADTSVGDPVFTPENTAELTYALTQVVEKGSGETASSLGVPIAGKTGSTNENKAAWFAGYTPEFVTVVSMFQSGPNGEQESITPFGGYKEITGATAPVDLWTDYMGRLLAGRPVLEFPERPSPPKPTFTPTPTPDPTTEPPAPTTGLVPDGLVGSSADAASGAIAAAGLTPSVSEQFDPSAPGTVISVNPGPGSEVPLGSTVAVVVSKGPEPAPEPDPTTPAPAPAPEPSTPAPEPTTDPAPSEPPPADAGAGQLPGG